MSFKKLPTPIVSEPDGIRFPVRIGLCLEAFGLFFAIRTSPQLRVISGRVKSTAGGSLPPGGFIKQPTRQAFS
jgi:hypothetical protein